MAFRTHRGRIATNIYRSRDVRPEHKLRYKAYRNLANQTNLRQSNGHVRLLN